MHRSRTRTTLLATLSVFALVAVACGGDDDDDASTGTDAVVSTDASADTAAEDTASEDTASEDTASEETTPVDTATDEPTAGTGEPDGNEGDSADRELPPGESHVEDDEGEPVQGGDLVFGIEADSANPWAPFRTSCATACYVMMTSVSDPLFTATPDGEIAPVLVESYEPNEDYTEWTFTIRDGITFHDGTPLDGAAVEFNYESCQYSNLTGAAYAPIESVESSGQDVIITTRIPYVALPRLTTERQCAYMFSPEWLGTLEDIPQRNPDLPIYDAELAATPATGDPAKPVGLGAYTFESYTPGNGNSFKLVRNEDYWRGPNGITGEELPYLDSVEGVVAVDIDSRSSSLRSGQFDLIHSSNADTISQFLEDDSFETIATSLFGDTNYIMLNLAEGDTDPNGDNADSPLLNVNCRKALAHAIDVEQLIEVREAGLTLQANGPFGPGMLGYSEDTGYPTYDPDAAVEEMDTCLSEVGTDSIEFQFNTTNDPFNVETVALISSMWDEAFGGTVTTTTTPIEQGAIIGVALTGAFEALLWRNHGGIDPATQSYWWSTTSAAPVGDLALNFGRFKDADMDAQFETILSDPDPAARQAAAEEVNRIFAEQVYNIWTTWALWSVIEHPYVNGLETNALPDGGDGVGLAFSGRHQMNQIWCDDGTCE
ncbi:MAG: ABC transporter substrate-binding protein [Ilumatobacteraceae bacterium]